MMHILSRLAAALTLFMGFLNAWRAIAQLQQRSVLVEYGATIPVSFIIAMSTLWAILMIWGGIVAWRQPAKVKLLIPLLFLTYTLYSLWLPTETLPSLYGHLFLMIFTAVSLRGSNKISKRQTLSTTYD